MQKESGSATVVGFVLIFAIVIALIALYFAAVVPAEEERAAEVSVISAKEDMISFSLLLNELERVPHMPLSYLPVFSKEAAAELTSGGSLSVNGETISVNKLVFSTASSEIGLSAGGIYRSDDGNAVWLSRPEISVSKDGVACIIPQYHGSFSRGTSSEGIPFTAEYLGTSVMTIHSESPVSFVYSGEDSRLWYALFYELAAEYSVFDSPRFTETAAEVTLLPKETMRITVLCPEYMIS